MTIENAIAENTDLISKLPTQEGLKNIMTRTVEDNLFQARRIVSEGMNSIRYSVEVQSSNQTNCLKEMMHTELKNMKNELKARDLTPWRLRLKWAAIGSILPLIVCILQLILR